MSVFGWSLPPGCGTLPGEQTDAVELTDLVTLPTGVLGVFWDEDNRLIEVCAPPDDAENRDTYERFIGTWEWQDIDVPQDELNVNRTAAAAHYQSIVSRNAIAAAT